MMAHNREGSHQTGTFARGAKGWCPRQEPWLLDLHQRQEPLKCLALKSNRADIQWSQSAIENWDSLLNKGLKVKVKSLSLRPTLCDPMDYSPPGSSVHGILQARILEWVAISFSRGSSWPRDQTQVSCIAGRCFNLWATSLHVLN